ncbi:Hypothetical predicted protein [Paramuricea clavata]|nr:Hypothetical predicted protein [Paramuricea clavata]
MVIVCSKQIPEEQHSTYPATDEAHFTSHEYHDQDLKVNVGERLIRAAAQPVDYQGGATIDNRQVLFHLNTDAQIANRNDLKKITREKRNDLDQFMGMIKANEIFTRNAGTLRNSPAKHFRLDMQGMVKRNGRDYHNMQVQMNGKRSGSSTYANVLVPKDANGFLADRVIRRAFYDSSNGNAAVTLEIGNKVVQG